MMHLYWWFVLSYRANCYDTEQMCGEHPLYLLICQTHAHMPKHIIGYQIKLHGLDYYNYLLASLWLPQGSKGKQSWSQNNQKWKVPIVYNKSGKLFEHQGLLFFSKSHISLCLLQLLSFELVRLWVGLDALSKKKKKISPVRNTKAPFHWLILKPRGIAISTLRNFFKTQ